MAKRKEMSFDTEMMVDGDKIILYGTIPVIILDTSIFPKKHRPTVVKFIRTILANPVAVINKKSFGSTNPKMVAKAIRKEEKWLKKFKV